MKRVIWACSADELLAGIYCFLTRVIGLFGLIAELGCGALHLIVGFELLACWIGLLRLDEQERWRLVGRAAVSELPSAVAC